MRIDPELTSLHAYGCLVIALYDGRLLAVAIAAPEGADAEDRRLRRQSARRPPVIAWSGGGV